MKKKIVAACLALVMAIGASAQAATTDVATYKGGTITAKEFETFEGINRLFNPYYDDILTSDNTYRTTVARQLIALEIVGGKMPKAKIGSYKNRAKNELASIRDSLTKNAGSAANYKKLLGGYGVTEADITTYLMRSDYVSDVFRAKITNAERKKQYKKMKKENQFMVASVRHILIMTNDPNTQQVKHTDAEAKKLATKYRKQLLKGKSFSALAKAVSEDPGSKAKGGLYKDADINNWVTEFKNAIIKQKLNTIGPLVKTMYGYHIIRVESRKHKKLSEVKTDVDNELFQQKFQAYTTKSILPLITSLKIPN